MASPIFRPSHIGFLKFGVEPNGILDAEATALEAAPALDYIGYGGIPNISINEGAQVVQAVGTPRGVDEIYGDRDVQFRVNLKLGRLDFINYLIRDSGAVPANQTYYGMPILALGGGSSNNYAGTGFTWLCRYCVCNSFTVRFSEGSGQPVTLEADFLALACDEAGALQTVNATALTNAAGRVLTWAHSDILVGNTSYRSRLGGATLTVNNNVKPDGRRPDFGVTNPLSRTPSSLLPHEETLSVQYTMKDKLPPELRSRWTNTKLRASNALSGATSPKVFELLIANTLISETSLSQAEVGQPFSFSASGVSRFLTVTQSS